MRVKTVLTIPGPWTTLEPIRAALRAAPLGGPESGELELTLRPAPPETAERILASCAPGTFVGDEAGALRRAGRCLFVVDERGGTETGAARLIQVAQTLLGAGGAAVKVETSGCAHAPQRYALLNADHATDRLRAFLTIVASPVAGWGSVWMHNLGLRDVALPANTPATEVGSLARSFLHMLVEARPEFEKNTLWSAVAGGPRFWVDAGASRFPADSLVHNPFGEWRLRCN